MDLWSEVGLLWDRAIDGDPAFAAQRASTLATSSTDAAERAMLLGSRVLCEILLCHYEDARRSAVEAAEFAATATGPFADDARYYTASVRLVAAAMFDPP